MASDDINILDEIKHLLTRQPFIGFTIVMSSGDRYDISERHQVAVGQAGIVVVPPEKTHSVLRANQIVSIDVNEPV
jgi:hypothetical protein